MSNHIYVRRLELELTQVHPYGSLGQNQLNSLVSGIQERMKVKVAEMASDELEKLFEESGSHES